MITRICVAGLKAKLHQFRACSSANMAVMFALSLVPIVGAVGAAVDYSQANSIKAAMQAAADSAALGGIKAAPSQTQAQLQSAASGLFNASFNRPQVSPTVSASYDTSTKILTVGATTTFTPNLVRMVGITSMPISVTAKSKIGSKLWPICAMVTNGTSGHTLLVKNNSHINFTNCMVQVNTSNWDAVEARDTSYIHSTNGVNCFVGDIHYGDVTPPKDPTCTFFPDPFASYTAPVNTCTYTNFKANVAGMMLSPGTYCGGINVSKDATFSPGVYYIQSGDFVVGGSSNVTANGATFVISGAGSNINFTTTGTMTMSPYTDASAGQWAGFLFYYDLPSGKATAGTHIFSKGKLNASGIIYLVGQTMSITSGEVVTLNPGAIIADFILPDNGTLNLTGDLGSPIGKLDAMAKSRASEPSTPVLVN